MVQASISLATSIVGTLLSVRGAHAVLAHESSKRQIPAGQVITLDLPLGLPGKTRAPLGWALSKGVRDAMLDEADRVVDAVMGDLRTALTVKENQQCRRPEQKSALDTSI